MKGVSFTKRRCDMFVSHLLDEIDRNVELL